MVGPSERRGGAAPAPQSLPAELELHGEGDRAPDAPAAAELRYWMIEAGTEIDSTIFSSVAGSSGFTT